MLEGCVKRVNISLLANTMDCNDCQFASIVIQVTSANNSSIVLFFNSFVKH